MPDADRPARVDDLHELALGMPHVKVVPGGRGNPVYQVGGKSFVFFRTPRPDAVDPRTGERYPDVVVLWVESESDKQALVQDPRSPSASVQVEAACGAFLNYYLDHRFEINLGLYAFRGLKRLGVGKPSDDELNQALWKVLERIAVPLTEVRGLKPAEVRPWVALLTSQMIGALVLQIAGRLDFLDTGAQALLRMMLAQCVPDGAAPKGRKA